MAGKIRRELLARVRDVVVAEGVTFGVCREGFPEFVTGQTCDGSHLIPERKQKIRLSRSRPSDEVQETAHHVREPAQDTQSLHPSLVEEKQGLLKKWEHEE